MDIVHTGNVVERQPSPSDIARAIVQQIGPRPQPPHQLASKIDRCRWYQEHALEIREYDTRAKVLRMSYLVHADTSAAVTRDSLSSELLAIMRNSGSDNSRIDAIRMLAKLHGLDTPASGGEATYQSLLSALRGRVDAAIAEVERPALPSAIDVTPLSPAV